VIGHARRGVDFDEKEFAAVAIAHEVDPAPAGAIGHAEGRERRGLQFGLGAGVDAARAVILRIVADVFRLVVVELRRRLDADRRQRRILEHAHREFVAADERFREHDGVDGPRFGVRRRQIRGALDLGDAHARPLRGGLHHHGQTDAFERSGQILGARQHGIVGRGVPRADYDPLGLELIHGQGRGEHAAARVGDAQPLERALHRAILAPWPVQDDECTCEAPAPELCDRPLLRVEGVGVDAAALQRGEHGIA
jgi:hypothetical protein